MLSHMTPRCSICGLEPKVTPGTPDVFAREILIIHKGEAICVHHRREDPESADLLHMVSLEWARRALRLPHRRFSAPEAVSRCPCPECP